MSHCPPSACQSCPAHQAAEAAGFGIKEGDWDYLVALAGNPNTGKSTVFNALTGLRQHTGNWPGKTVSRAEGLFRQDGQRFKLVDLPGAYSLLGVSRDEGVTADFLEHGNADVALVVLDATVLERNLAFLLQVLNRMPRCVVALNLMDEARARGLSIDARGLSRDLGVPVVPIAARRGEGLKSLKEAVLEVASGRLECHPLQIAGEEEIAQRYHEEASRLAQKHVQAVGKDQRRWQDRLDYWLTHPATGFPLMALIMAGVLWLTIEGANVPSGMLAELLIDKLHPWLQQAFAALGSPAWLTGVVVDGAYLTLAWVVSVMLPPMAIFFPLFTLLEDFGYLPRVAFNLDPLFQRSGAHGKQALTMAMGYGCNAAGVIATRIIESPRERLIAILTNNFALCNGRWPTQILIASVFLGGLVAPAYAGLTATAAVFGVAGLGVLLTFISSWVLSRTLLKGEAAAFSLELPPFRPPNVLRTLYTSLIDRTLFVLWRAMVFAAPAGIVIWLIANVGIEGQSLAAWAVHGLDPVGTLVGLNGVILLAYVIAIPANEIVIPTVLMLTVQMTGHAVSGYAGSGVLFETGDAGVLLPLLHAGGWTTLTAVCLMLFSLCHNPCSTTLYTIYKETGSVKWTTWAAVMPTVLGFMLCGLLALGWRLTV
ncbi:MAG: GTP-binding protein HSR1-related [Puniceicoccaceae bacterium 5H]|nr:MAG: GTP-binding protein HSR1-related [Puniceicoccaceae bacterium 5H]